MTEAQRLADELREALTIGREAAYEVAQTYHASMAGYRQYEHDRLDADVKKIDAAIDRLASLIPAGGLAEEARDAARYRWLASGERTRQGVVLPDTGTRLLSKSESQALLSFNYWCSRVELDAAIDASMAASTPQGKETPDVQDR